MSGILINLYPWIKSLHLIAVISWMAGIFYLPRLFVYHAEQSKPKDNKDIMLQEMEQKLLAVIMTPAMIITWLCGMLLALTPGVIDWSLLWPYTKTFSIIFLTSFHFWLSNKRKDFVAGKNKLSGRTYRIMNEIPTVLLVIIIISVILKF